MKHLFQKYRSDLLGLVWFFWGGFVAASLIGYEPEFPFLMKSMSMDRHSPTAGYLGELLSHSLYFCLGLSAWAIVGLSARRALRHFSKKEPTGTGVLWTDAVFLLCLCTLVDLYFAGARIYAGKVRIEGWVGHELGGALGKVLGKVGLGIFLWTAIAAILILYTDRTWSQLARIPWRALTHFLALVGAWLRALKLPQRLENWPFINPPPTPITTPATPPIPTPGSAKITAAANTPSVIDLRAPISGFLKEQSQGRGLTATRLGLASAQRRVENWTLPKLSLLEEAIGTRTRLDEREIKLKARLLVEKLAQFSVRGEVVGIKPGPAVTMFEFRPAVDVKISKITELGDDLSLALSSESVRIIAPIPGRDVVGIETSNSQRESVVIKDIISQDAFWEDDNKLPVALGRKADGEPRIVDLRKMPHLLVAGSTGSGKSVFIVSLITGLLFRHSPKTLRLILVDPKQVDLAAFNDVPHLIMPPIREAKKAVGALRWAIREMEKRYRSMSKFGARGLEAFNETVSRLDEAKIQEHARAHETLEGAYHPHSYYFQSLAYIAIVVEEFGDLMAVDKVNVEAAVVRLAQMARACGIHLVLAMQSPRRDVVTGLIKTNIPGRISFKVASKMDSRIILDEGGAERLLARGDMLFLAPGVSKPERHHGPYLSESEIAQVVSSWKSQGEPEFDPIAMKVIEGTGGGFNWGDSGDGGSQSDNSTREGDIDAAFGDGEIKDERYDEVIAWVASQKEVSASMLQRKFRLGYPRAARMIEIFESEGVVGPANGSKPRQVLVRELPST